MSSNGSGITREEERIEPEPQSSEPAPKESDEDKWDIPAFLRQRN